MLPMNNGWISVDDAMPPFNTEAILLVNSYFIIKGFYDTLVNEDYEFRYAFNEIELEVFFVKEPEKDIEYPEHPRIESKVNNIFVTHWMPLPNLPVEEDQIIG